MTAQPTRSRPRRRFFGTGVLVALGAIALLYATGKLTPEQPSVPAAALASVEPLRLPLKPEALWLEQQASELGLSLEQRRQVGQVAREWGVEKESLQKQLAAFTGQGRSLEAVKGSLTQYGALSREYDQKRQQYWEAALALLTKPQQDAAQARLSGGKP